MHVKIVFNAYANSFDSGHAAQSYSGHQRSLHILTCLNSLPNDKILDWFKLKAFANDKIYVNEKLKFVL